MTQTQNRQKLEQLVQRIDPQNRLLRFWSLKGGISAQVTALEIKRPDGMTQKLVVRQHGALDLEHNPNIAADEFNLLQYLQSHKIPAPKPYFVDSELFAIPCIVIEFVEGAPEFASTNLDNYLLQSATTLAQIHRIDGATPELSYLPQHIARQTEKLSQRPTQLDESLSEGHIRDTLEAVWPLKQINQSALLHGDYWPGNLLWNEGRLAAVIDWEDASLGDPLTDLGNTRLEILWAFGSEAMQHFTHHYQSVLPHLDFSHLPYWDLCAALRPASRMSGWGLDAATEQKMRAGHKLFVTQAFDTLSAHQPPKPSPAGDEI